MYIRNIARRCQNLENHCQKSKLKASSVFNPFSFNMYLTRILRHWKSNVNALTFGCSMKAYASNGDFIP
ncbi:hypothetical protein SAMN05444412_1101, partial [Rhodonellum ikkaensis]